MSGEIRQVRDDSERVIDNASVTAGGSTSSTEVRLDGTKNNVTMAYSLTASGSPQVELELYYGNDASGNPIWIPAGSSTNNTDVITFDGSAEMARVTVTETGGAAGLSDVYAWISGRPL